MTFERITHDPTIMDGKACIRWMRVTVSMVLGLLSAGETREEILRDFPDLEPEYINACLGYASWRFQER